MERLNENATNEEIIDKVNEIINFLDSQAIVNVEVYKLLGNILKNSKSNWILWRKWMGRN